MIIEYVRITSKFITRNLSSYDLYFFFTLLIPLHNLGCSQWRHYSNDIYSTFVAEFVKGCPVYIFFADSSLQSRTRIETVILFLARKHQSICVIKSLHSSANEGSRARVDLNCQVGERMSQVCHEWSRLRLVHSHCSGIEWPLLNETGNQIGDVPEQWCIQ